MLLRGRKLHSPAIEAEKPRAWNGDGRHEAALLLDLAANREATGRRDSAIDAIVDLLWLQEFKIPWSGFQHQARTILHTCTVSDPTKTRMDEHQYRC